MPRRQGVDRPGQWGDLICDSANGPGGLADNDRKQLADAECENSSSSEFEGAGKVVGMRRISDPVWPVIGILLASSGCFSTNGSDLVGRWEGQLQVQNSTAEAATIDPPQNPPSTPRLALDPTAVRVTLVCHEDQFEMSLHRPDGSSDRAAERGTFWNLAEADGWWSSQRNKPSRRFACKWFSKTRTTSRPAKSRGMTVWERFVFDVRPSDFGRHRRWCYPSARFRDHGCNVRCNTQAPRCTAHHFPRKTRL